MNHTRCNTARQELITDLTESIILTHQTYIALSVTCYTRSQNSVSLHDKLDRANLLVTGGQSQPLSVYVGRDA